ncbi:MAG: hypothetical protein CM15mP102_20260 [Flavobacteriales bacterium]|nr:MAG: hypothetical protein CM15mP102_20260 [Flavobacteriales bacterium]
MPSNPLKWRNNIVVDDENREMKVIIITAGNNRLRED